MKKPSVEERIIQGLEGFAEALEKGEDITKRFTCRKIVLNLHPTSYSPEQVKATRALLGMSQALFAQFLGVSVNLVQAWEQGQRKPEHMACRFLEEIRNDPDYWRERFLELAESKGETVCA